MLQTIKPFSKAGFALLWLKESQKRPVNLNWTGEPRSTFDELRRFYTHGLNVGVRLGEPSKIGDLYLHALDVDIRNDKYVPVVHGYLDALLPEWRRLPTVISGSGGASRHIYFLTDSPFASKKLANSGTKVTDAEGKDHYHWEVELFGTGKQVVMPPSIHPCGQPYRWEREFDFDDLDMGLGPYVPEDRVRAWARKKPESAPDGDPDDLLADVLAGRLDDFTIAQARSVLGVFDPSFWDDRDDWRDAGMALKHQFGDETDAFDLWCEFSRLSEKYDLRVQRQQWDSFKDRRDGITFRSLIAVANRIRAEEFRSSLSEVAGGAIEDDDDLIGDIGPTNPKEEEYNADWVDELVKVTRGGTKGDPKFVLEPGLHNTRLIIENDRRLRGTFALNSFQNQIVLLKSPSRKRQEPGQTVFQLDGDIWRIKDPKNGDLWSDQRENSIRAMLETPGNQGGYGLKVTDRDLHAAIDVVAAKRAFHPIRDWIEREQWNGVPQVDTLFIDYLGCPDTAYHRAVARLLVVAAVARLYEPGHKFDFAPIIEGAQGTGKSTFIRTLANNWFSELSSEFNDDKRMVESMQGSFVIEIGELSGFNRHDVQSIKSFMSRTHDKVRMAYARNVSLFPRQCVFIGSTNDKRYLRDESGGRRFWPIEIGVDMIDNPRLRRNAPQIWSEGLAIYRQMRSAQPHGDLPLFLRDADAAKEATALQESRRIETADDALLGQVQAWLDEPIKGDGFEGEDGDGARRDRACLIEIAVECMGLDRRVYSEKPALAQQLTRVMTRVKGWIPGGRHRFEKWGQQRSYFRTLPPVRVLGRG